MSERESGERDAVQLSIPDHLNYQLVYRLRRQEPFAAEPPDDVAYHYVPRPGALPPGVRGLFGTVGFLKTWLKLTTSGRAFYCLRAGDKVVGYGWLTFGRCKFYHIEPSDVIIGPVTTLRAHRGKGLATLGLKLAINSLIEAGQHVFFIDTSKDNVAMQKVIAKCAFGPPVAAYLRGPD